MTKEALQIALEALTDFDYDKRMSAIEIIKEALETKDEPVAWMNRHGACKTSLFREMEAGAKEEYTIPVYTQPQRTWVGLTDEDMNNALDYWSDNSRSSYGGAHAANGEYVDMIETWRYIEAKLKECNT